MTSMPKSGTPENHCTAKRINYLSKFIYGRKYERCTFEKHDGPHSYDYRLDETTGRWVAN